MSVKNVMRKETAPTSATMPVQRAKTLLRRVNSPAAPSKAAKPIAAARYGPADAAVTALLTTGSASAPSLVAAATITMAIAIPVIPVRATANATRASCAEPRTDVSALPSTHRIVPTKCRNAKPPSKVRNPPMPLFDWLSSAQFVQS